MTDSPVLACRDLRDYFASEVHQATDRQHVALNGATEAYLADLLAGFSRTEALLDTAADGRLATPLLARTLARALSAGDRNARDHQLRRLGDVALFWAGFFAHGLARKLVDVDYYVAMGGEAYRSLSAGARAPSLASRREVFGELAAKFVPVTDVLADLAEGCHRSSPDDILRYYEIWQKTGSRRAHAKLAASGIAPVRGAAPGTAH